jgi:hypothetical protein
MILEKCHKGIRYTLGNDGLKDGDHVYPIANGRCIDGGGWVLHDIDWTRFTDDQPHVIENINHSDYKPYEVRTGNGYGPKEIYYKVIKREHQVVVKETQLPGGLIPTFTIKNYTF